MANRTNGRFPWEKYKKMTAAAYSRDLDATRGLPYAEKFADFFRIALWPVLGSGGAVGRPDGWSASCLVGRPCGLATR